MVLWLLTFFMLFMVSCSDKTSSPAKNAEVVQDGLVEQDLEGRVKPISSVESNSDAEEKPSVDDVISTPDDEVGPPLNDVASEDVVEGNILELQALAILEENCAACHQARGDGNFSSVLDVDVMLRDGYLIAGESQNSSVYIRTDPEAAGSMPIGRGLDKEQRQILLSWIQSLKTPVQPQMNITWPMVHDIVRQDLEQNVTDENREQTRYVSFHHVYEQGLQEAEMLLYRDALLKTLNSVSKSATPVMVQEVHAEYGIYRFSLADMSLERELYRTTLENYNPFLALSVDDSAGIFLRNVIGADAIVRGDWLVSTVLLPPLYKLWLDLPDTLSELKQNLQISDQSFLEKENLARAGFLDSRVSTQNRVIQREVTAGGTFFWESFDFLENIGTQNIFFNPLGPVAENPEGSAFEQDGGEMIFELPNGFLGFYLSDADGNYLERGPKAVVFHEQGPKGFDQNILNGFSCMDCHRAGLIPHEDQIRQFVVDQNFSDAETAQVLKVYQADDVMNNYIKGDSDRYQKALAAVGYQSEISEDVLKYVYDEYHKSVTMQQAAFELDVNVDMIQTLLQNSLTFREQWSGFVFGQAISREQFNTLYGSAKRVFDHEVLIPLQGDLQIDTQCMQESTDILTACLVPTVNIDFDL